MTYTSGNMYLFQCGGCEWMEMSIWHDAPNKAHDHARDTGHRVTIYTFEPSTKRSIQYTKDNDKDE